MPNWVYTEISVHGNPEKIAEFRDKAKKPYNTYYPDWKTKEIKEDQMEGDLLFWNFIEPEDKTSYFADAHGTQPEGYESWSMEEKLSHSMKFTGEGWYDWNIRNWGTKWEARGALDQEDEDGKYLRYKFDTAWSPAEPAFQAIVSQHPELWFGIRCEEEQGWGVEYEAHDGVLSTTSEWDIPTSHADWVELDKEESCICDWEANPTEWYSDCPRKELSETELGKLEDLVESF